MKPMTALITAAVFSVLSLNACGGSEKSMSIQEQTEARFQLNPHPKQAYRLRIKINDAPGPLKLMRNMSVGYGARDCSYIINHIEGASANPEKKYELKPVNWLNSSMKPLFMQMLYKTRITLEKVSVIGNLKVSV